MTHDMIKAYIFLSDGFETIEATTPIDVFRRCGIEVRTVSITSSLEVSSSHKIQIIADCSLADGGIAEEIAKGDLIYLPGGYPNFQNLCNSEEVGKIASSFYASGKWVAAICAAPLVLDKNNIALGKKVTCHECAVEAMSKRYKFTDAEIQQDGNLITARGAGISLPFSLYLAKLLAGPETVAKVRHSLELE